MKERTMVDHKEKPNTVEILFVDSWNAEEIVQLYKAGGWWKDTYDSSKIQTLISGSFAFAVIVETRSGKAIGMGRLISDGVADAYIQDLVIFPQYRGFGYGKQLCRKLIDHGISKGLRWIGLIAEPGNEQFFLDIGFKLMKDHYPMLYQKEER
jgi:ribosomal protein S18 acetylase RimI-like enzyme